MLEVGDHFPVEKLSVKPEGPAVVYFYPADLTPGCTMEAKAFNDRYDRFRDAGYEVIGVSVDSVERHVERRAGRLRAGRVAAEHDHVVPQPDHLVRVGAEVLPPLLVDRVEHRRAYRGQAPVQTAVGQPLRLVPLDLVVHHRQGAVEIAATEGLVRAADGFDAHSVTAASTSSGCSPASVTSQTCWTVPSASSR